MQEKGRNTASADAPQRITSMLQAILHFGEDGMETISVPVPLPDAVIRVREHPQNLSDGAGAAGREQVFRRVPSPDSVVRYYECREVELSTGDGRPRSPPRRCSNCGEAHDAYFVRAIAPEERIGPYTPALCAGCYSRVPLS
jgi:hypothetical protein